MTAGEPVPYTAGDRPRVRPDDLRARIPGWGADLDPRDRPSVPREVIDREAGAHWTFPERQPEGDAGPRERSIEHLALPPVFGTTVPLKGVSGVMRRFAYARYSEARAAHWLLLLAADRVDVAESRLSSLVRRGPLDPILPTGLRSERTHHGVASRVGVGRVDAVHQTLDPVVAAAPWVVAGGAVAFVARRARSRTRAR